MRVGAIRRLKVIAGIFPQPQTHRARLPSARVPERCDCPLTLTISQTEESSTATTHLRSSFLLASNGCVLAAALCMSPSSCMFCPSSSADCWPSMVRRAARALSAIASSCTWCHSATAAAFASLQMDRSQHLRQHSGHITQVGGCGYGRKGIRSLAS